MSVPLIFGSMLQFNSGQFSRSEMLADHLEANSELLQCDNFSAMLLHSETAASNIISIMLLLTVERMARAAKTGSKL